MTTKTTIKSNLKRTVSNLGGALAAILEVSSELVADASTLSVSAIKQVKPVGKELLQSPLSARKGYLVEQGMDEVEAEAQAFAVLENDLSSAIKSGSEKSGALLASLLEGWDDIEEVADTKK